MLGPVSAAAHEMHFSPVISVQCKTEDNKLGRTGLDSDGPGPQTRESGRDNRDDGQ